MLGFNLLSHKMMLIHAALKSEAPFQLTLTLTNWRRGISGSVSVSSAGRHSSSVKLCIWAASQWQDD